MKIIVDMMGGDNAPLAVLEGTAAAVKEYGGEVIGVGDEFLAQINDGDTAIVDGFTGEIYLDPDEQTLAKMEEKRAADEEKKRLLQDLKGKENVTLDGKKINIYANIGSVDKIGAVLL